MGTEFDYNIPIYIQLVEQIKISIISGEILPGERLPSVREWAMKYKVNPNTMQKALVELEDLGIVFTERTNGKYVTEDKKLIGNLREEYAREITEQYFNNMKQLGFTKDDTINYFMDLGGKK